MYRVTEEGLTVSCQESKLDNLFENINDLILPENGNYILTQRVINSLRPLYSKILLKKRFDKWVKQISATTEVEPNVDDIDYSDYCNASKLDNQSTEATIQAHKESIAVLNQLILNSSDQESAKFTHGAMLRLEQSKLFYQEQVKVLRQRMGQFKLIGESMSSDTKYLKAKVKKKEARIKWSKNISSTRKFDPDLSIDRQEVKASSENLTRMREQGILTYLK